MSTETVSEECEGDEISKVAAEVFKKLEFDSQHFAIFDEVFRLILRSIEDEQHIDPVRNPKTLFDPLDPEDGTWWEHLVEQSGYLLKIYLQELGNNHSKAFARAYMLAMYDEPDDEDNALNKAYLSLSPLSQSAIYNPRYAEAFLWSLRSGKGETYAHFFSNSLVCEDYSPCITTLMASAQKYADAVQNCLETGFSIVYAHAFAGQLVAESNQHYAHIYAKFYVRLLEMGYSHSDAFGFAYHYTELHGCGSDYLEELEVSEVLKILANEKEKEARSRKRLPNGNA